MDSDDIGAIFLLLFFLLGIPTLIVLGITGHNADAVASEAANIYCLDKGYDVYESYNRKLLGEVPFGIKCNHINNKQEFVGLDNSVAVVSVS